MNANTTEKRYEITFPGQAPMRLAKDQILSPTLRRAIDNIEKEPACVGVTLKNGIQINIA